MALRRLPWQGLIGATTCRLVVQHQNAATERLNVAEASNQPGASSRPTVVSQIVISSVSRGGRTGRPATCRFSVGPLVTIV